MRGGSLPADGVRGAARSGPFVRSVAKLKGKPGRPGGPIASLGRQGAEPAGHLPVVDTEVFIRG